MQFDTCYLVVRPNAISGVSEIESRGTRYWANACIVMHLLLKLFLLTIVLLAATGGNAAREKSKKWYLIERRVLRSHRGLLVKDLIKEAFANDTHLEAFEATFKGLRSVEKDLKKVEDVLLVMEGLHDHLVKVDEWVDLNYSIYQTTKQLLNWSEAFKNERVLYNNPSELERLREYMLKYLEELEEYEKQMDTVVERVLKEVKFAWKGA